MEQGADAGGPMLGGADAGEPMLGS
jgi:hypothetical protein